MSKLMEIFIMRYGAWIARSASIVALCTAACAAAMPPTDKHENQFAGALQAIKALSIHDNWKEPEAAMSALHGSNLQVEHTDQDYTDHYQCPQGCPTEEKRVEYKFDGWIGDPSGRLVLHATLLTQTTVSATAGGATKNTSDGRLSLKLTGESRLSRTEVAGMFGRPDGKIHQSYPLDAWDTYYISTLLGPRHSIAFHPKKTKSSPRNDSEVIYDSVVIE